VNQHVAAPLDGSLDERDDAWEHRAHSGFVVRVVELCTAVGGTAREVGQASSSFAPSPVKIGDVVCHVDDVGDTEALEGSGGVRVVGASDEDTARSNLSKNKDSTRQENQSCLKTEPS